ncbi:uncharacterized protein B0I36DRAFT_351865 [Microdochium trichocladiopsis]|uniref:Uncharacterized protein n=1 Tax=Microdochium trichocladiopsis TaxID=1682393 RepID=A0A9P8XZV8_9PEZI|nr:uncharacterized protein B0I36DRAFT_351865 [Microdochium trichocladiopsis]KAH7025926.1 hypothetical protein B0I36DRAFT_351865 [Microdochium trichocladiopsis]
MIGAILGFGSGGPGLGSPESRAGAGRVAQPVEALVVMGDKRHLVYKYTYQNTRHWSTERRVTPTMGTMALHQYLQAESKRWEAQQRLSNPYYKAQLEDSSSTTSTSEADMDDSRSVFSRPALSRCSSATSVASEDLDDGLHILPQPMLAAAGLQGITVYASLEDAVAQSNATLALQRAAEQQGRDIVVRRLVTPGKLYENEEDDDEIIEYDDDDEEAALAEGFATG